MAKSKFPRRLRLVPGKGFDHEIVDDAAESCILVARVSASENDGGLELAKLFAASPALLEAAQALLRALDGGKNDPSLYIATWPWRAALVEAIVAAGGEA